MKYSSAENESTGNPVISGNKFKLGVTQSRNRLLAISALLGLFFVSTVPTVVQASATNCDYRPNFAAYATGAPDAYAQCMTVKGRSLDVWEINSYFIRYVTANLGPAIPTPIPNVRDICNTAIQWKYKKNGNNSYTYNTRNYGCTRPAIYHKEDRKWTPRHLKLKDKSSACMRWKSDRTGNRYTGWTCIQIKK